MLAPIFVYRVDSEYDSPGPLNTTQPIGALVLFPGEEFFFNSLRSCVRLGGAKEFPGETGKGGGLCCG